MPTSSAAPAASVLIRAEASAGEQHSHRHRRHKYQRFEAKGRQVGERGPRTKTAQPPPIPKTSEPITSRRSTGSGLREGSLVPNQPRPPACQRHAATPKPKVATAPAITKISAGSHVPDKIRLNIPEIPTKIDFEYPAEIVSVVLKSSGRLELKPAPGSKVDRRSEGEVHLTTESRANAWLPLEITLPTGGSDAALEVSWYTAEDARRRALPLRRVLLPWATPRAAASSTPAPRLIPEIAGGDRQRGREVFRSTPAACAVCHQVGGEGGIIGPDLSNLVHRDYASVLKDIVQPSAAINPDRLAYVVELKDGTTANGMFLDDTADAITLGDVTGNRRVIAKATIATMKASAVSLMPEGLWQALSSQQQRDLMTYLLTEATPAPTR